MTRLHKYQYWYSGKMLDVGQIEFFDNGTYRVNDELIGGVLREWTGLLDKNGKEIYEGDIVHQFGSINFTIEFYKSAFMAQGIGSTMRMWLNHPYGEIEIIGNIYQNPELLK